MRVSTCHGIHDACAANVCDEPGASASPVTRGVLHRLTLHARTVTLGRGARSPASSILHVFMHAPSASVLARHCASVLALLAAVGCADERHVTAPAGAPALVSAPVASDVVTPITVGVPTCGATVTSSAGKCLPSAGFLRGHAYALWSPDGEHDSCPQNVHDAYGRSGPTAKSTRRGTRPW